MKFIVESNIDNIPSDFFKIISDFANDICRVFPEYNVIVNKYILSEKSDECKLKLYNFVGKVVIQNKDFICTKNDELFLNGEEGVFNTEFLPRIVFSHIWEGDISEVTKSTIWKYLTLLFVTISKQQQHEKGDIDLDEILSGIMDDTTNTPETSPPIPTPTHIDPPFMSEIPEQLKGMMNGSLGKLAMELAQETSMDELNGNGKGSLDIFNMMGKIGSKIENKIKSGELSESSLIEESMGLISSMGGVNNIQSMMDLFKGQSKTNTAPSPLLKENRLLGRNNKNSQKTSDKKVRQRLRGSNPRNMVDTNNEESPEYTLPRFTDDELVNIFNNTSTINKK